MAEIKGSKTINGITYNNGDAVTLNRSAKYHTSADGSNAKNLSGLNASSEYYPDTYVGYSTTYNTAPYHVSYNSNWEGYWFAADAFPYAKYTIKYDVNGGNSSSKPDNQEKTHDTSLKISTNTPTRTGYTFRRWVSTRSDGTYYFNPGDTTSYNGNQTLVAEWTVNSYSYTLGSATGAITTGSTASGSKNYGTTITLKGVANTGYTWNKWKSSNTDIRADITTANTTFSMPAGNLTMTPVVTANTYTVTYNANGGTGTMAQSTVTYDSSFRTEQNTFTRTGYTFNGWNEEANGTGTAWGLTDEGVYESGKSSQWTYDKNITLYAQWLPNMYRMVLDCQGGKTQDGEESVQYNAIFDSFVGGLNYGQSLPIPIRPSYNFIGWNDKEDGEGVYYTGSETMNVVGGMVLYAIWEPAASLVTIYVDGQPRRGMMHMYNSSGELCYAIMTVYDEMGNPHLTI